MAAPRYAIGARLSLGGYDSQLSPAGTCVLNDALAVCEVIARKLRGDCSGGIGGTPLSHSF
ncbi:MAG: hypothetical protein EBE86_017230 [Hormoscilla sp. GUM202]|nr:hypothetical protein [Hormoscilla sp. GUM202]